MRLMFWLKFVVVLLIAVMVSIFFFQNTGPAAIQFPFTRVFHVKMVYLLFIAFSLGVVSALAGAVYFSTFAKPKDLEDDEEEALVDED